MNLCDTRVIEFPKHIVEGEAVAKLACVELEYKLTVTLKQVVYIHVPTARHSKL